MIVNHEKSTLYAFQPVFLAAHLKKNCQDQNLVENVNSVKKSRILLQCRLERKKNLFFQESEAP